MHCAVDVDDELKWNKHVLAVASKLIRLVSWFGRVCKHLQKSKLQLVYITKLLPVTNYVLSFWRTSTS